METVAHSINAEGRITGFYTDSNRVMHGFVREPSGHIISFDPLGSIGTNAVSINAKGTITGLHQDATRLIHGFMRHPGGEIVSFDVPESTGTIAVGINNEGTITGRYTKANGRDFGFARHAQGKFASFALVLTQSRRVSTTKERLRAITQTLMAVTSMALCGRRTERLPHSTRRFAASPNGTFAFGINDKGVITGSCTVVVGHPGEAWVRFP
jgi:hypothetical protein